MWGAVACNVHGFRLCSLVSVCSVVVLMTLLRLVSFLYSMCFSPLTKGGDFPSSLLLLVFVPTLLLFSFWFPIF